MNSWSQISFKFTAEYFLERRYLRSSADSVQIWVYCSLLVLHCIVVETVNNESCSFWCIVYVLCIHTPVNDVEEQVCQGKYDSGVGIDHVAVAHDEAEVLNNRVFSA